MKESNRKRHEMPIYLIFTPENGKKKKKKFAKSIIKKKSQSHKVSAQILSAVR